MGGQEIKGLVGKEVVGLEGGKVAEMVGWGAEEVSAAEEVHVVEKMVGLEGERAAGMAVSVEEVVSAAEKVTVVKEMAGSAEIEEGRSAKGTQVSAIEQVDLAANGEEGEVSEATGEEAVIEEEALVAVTEEISAAGDQRLGINPCLIAGRSTLGRFYFGPHCLTQFGEELGSSDGAREQSKFRCVPRKMYD